jgi:hypothetical protein
MRIEQPFLKVANMKSIGKMITDILSLTTTIRTERIEK